MHWTAQVTTYPFGISDPAPLRLLEQAHCELRLSPHGRKHRAEETGALLGDIDVLIAGTEPLNADNLGRGLPRLRLVSKVGVGLDGLDIDWCRAQGIAMTYTPEAPARSVVEQVFGQLISLSRRFIEAHEGLRQGQWRRLTGPLWEGRTLGIVGVGRIGKQVAELARAFRMRVLGHDIVEDHTWAKDVGLHYVDLPTLLRESHAVTLHLPLDDSTRHMIDAAALAGMRTDAYLLNTCRGPVLDETALVEALHANRLAGAAIDVFAQEPYDGPLCDCPRVFLTAHQGSCTIEGRYAMEVGAAENAIAFLRGEPIPPGNIVWLPPGHPSLAGST